MRRPPRSSPLPSLITTPFTGSFSCFRRAVTAAPAPAKSAGLPVATAVCRASASARSLSLLVSMRSTREESGGEETVASVVARVVDFDGPGGVAVIPCSFSRSPKVLAASAAGSATRDTGPLEESSVRPSSAIRG